MKKLLLLLLFILLVFSSCSNLKHSKFKKNSNVKEFVISKYGKPNIIENNEELEVWKYESNRSLKNNRTIVFNENEIYDVKVRKFSIIKLATGIVGTYGAFVVIGILALAGFVL